MFFCRLTAFFAALGLGVLWAAPPPEAFGDRITDPAAVDKAWPQLPAPVRRAADFQKLLLQIRGGLSIGDWKPQMLKFSGAAGDDGVTVALREVAKIWLARAAMVEIDGALRKYYRQQVRFPDSLAEVEREIPADAKQDPWTESWIYHPSAPQGFTNLKKQRYQLAPKRYPILSTVDEAIKAKPAPLGWKLTPREVGGNKVIELHGSDGKVAMLEPGGRAGDVILVFVGDGWALLADTERLFTVTF